MGANLTKVFVVDVEATCWRTKEEQGGKPNELIEIGICELHRDGSIQNKRSYPIIPRNFEISDFCTELTGWTAKDLKLRGQDITDVLDVIGDDYGMTKNHVWFSFGEYDRIKLSSSPEEGSLLTLYNIHRESNPFARLRSHINVKTLMALKERLPKELGMSRALAHYGEKLEGRHHNGADDAYNIAKIVRRVLS